MLRRLQAWRGSAEGAQWRSRREQLPVGQIRQALLEALTQQDVAVVGGDTGCGKTTQVHIVTTHQRSPCSAPSSSMHQWSLAPSVLSLHVTSFCWNIV